MNSAYEKQRLLPFVRLTGVGVAVARRGDNLRLVRKVIHVDWDEPGICRSHRRGRLKAAQHPRYRAYVRAVPT